MPSLILLAAIVAGAVISALALARRDRSRRKRLVSMVAEAQARSASASGRPAAAAPAGRASPVRPGLLMVLALTAIVAIGARVAGPSDLAEKTQWKTIDYTADTVLNGRWLLPRDITGELASKPPLYNWIDAGVVGGLGVWAEWAFKLPSVVSALLLVILCAYMTRWMCRHGRPAEDAAGCHPAERQVTGAADPGAIGVVSGVLVLANYGVFRQLYIARPDMLVAVFVCGAWALATVVLARASRRQEGRGTALPALGMWLCVGAAGLTKGPMAVLPVLYLPLAAKLIYKRFSLVRAAHPWWGLPLAAGIFAAWAVPAAWLDPAHFYRVLIRTEVTDRVTAGGPVRILLDLWKMPAYLLRDAAPWSAFALLALVHIRPRSWLRHPLAPGVLWVLLNLAVFSCSAGKSARYLIPAYPAVAALAAYWLVSARARFRLTPRRVCLGALTYAVGLGAYQWTFSAPARTGFGDNIKAFVAQVRGIVGDDGIAFLNTRAQVASALLGRLRPGRPSPAALARARWVVQDYRQDGEPEVLSGPVYTYKPDRVALYRGSPAAPAPKSPPDSP